ncbi:MAG: hypothetical protein Q9227_004951 [Pyrenula ochraceoflavens]
MDPVTAFSLACGVVQLIDFGIKTTKTFHDIYKSKNAQTLEHQQLEREMQMLDASLASVTSRLDTKAQDALTPDQARLQRLAAECKGYARTLLGEINELKLTSPVRKRDVPSLWLKVMRRKSKIDAVQPQLVRCRGLLDTQMLVNLCHDVDTGNQEQLKRLRAIDLGFIQSLDTFRLMDDNFQFLFRDIEKSLAKTISDEGEQTRRLIVRHENQNKDRQKVEGLLQNLGFPTMQSRQEDIDEAYPSTFQWLFERKARPELPVDNFVDWLEKDSGVYWIKEEAFRNAAKSWAGDQKLIMATFFFWRAGTTEQKSINGLLRSILYQLIYSHPSLVRYLDVESHMQGYEWRDKRLRRAINTIIKQCQAESLKMCLLIDGLDEFEGPQGHEAERAVLVDIVQELLESDYVKAIVSSRLEQPFIDVFSSAKNLRLQDLTKDDMSHFVKGTLLQQDLMKNYNAHHPESVSKLIEEVVAKADGVFLWARLAVQDLIAGLWSRNTLDELKTRLALLKNTLDGIFAQLLSRIHQVDQESAANYIKFQAERVRETSKDTTVLDVALGCDKKIAADLQTIFIGELSNAELQKLRKDGVDKDVKEFFRWLRSMPAAPLSLCFVIRHGSTPYALKVLGEDHESSLSWLFDATVFNTFDCMRYLNKELGDLVDNDEDREENIDCFRASYQIGCGLELLQKCLKFGLDPNAKAKSKYPHFTLPIFILEVALICGSTHWLSYLACLNAISACGHIERVKPLCRQALDLTLLFVGQGADLNALCSREILSISLQLLKDNNEGARRYSFKFDTRAYRVIKDCSLRMDCSNALLDRKLQAPASSECLKAVEIETHYARFSLKSFTDEEQSELTPLVERYWDCVIDDCVLRHTNYRRYTDHEFGSIKEQLSAEADKVWEANSQCIESAKNKSRFDKYSSGKGPIQETSEDEDALHQTSSEEESLNESSDEATLSE